MGTEESLLRQILVSPFDDTPRWVLADYWDEVGLTWRADFVRGQLRDPYRFMDREGVDEDCRAWDGLKRKDIVVTYYRGFPSQIRLTFPQFDKLAKEIGEHWPVTDFIFEEDVIGADGEATGSWRRPEPSGYLSENGRPYHESYSHDVYSRRAVKRMRELAGLPELEWPK